MKVSKGNFKKLSYLLNLLDPMCYLSYLLLEANMMITVPM